MLVVVSCPAPSSSSSLLDPLRALFCVFCGGCGDLRCPHSALPPLLASAIPFSSYHLFACLFRYFPSPLFLSLASVPLLRAMGFSLLSILCCIWDVISAPVNRCLGRAADDSLGLIWERAAASARDFTRFWGNRVEQVNTSASCDLAGLKEIRGYEREIVDSLRDDGVGVIGIHGMGGVGKTTLLERINNNFSEIGAPPDFDVLIYATVSKEVSLPNVRKSIGKRIGLDLFTRDSAEEQANLIFKILRMRRFLLLLDDVWEEIRLKNIGIPQPTSQNRCKVILTTRSKEVCHDMGAKKLVEVKGLNEGESWRLFKENVGAGVDLESPTIFPRAKAVADKCGGLPLALKTVGRAMADANSVDEWRAALTQLNVSPHSMRGMTDKVLIPLYFSYKRLREETLKQCLLYCCLYPEDREIEVKEIIELWVGEGFLDEFESNGLIECRNRGFSVITRLVKASLLQNSSAGHVKMHDVVREMCLWLTQNIDKNNAFLVLTSGASNRMSSFGRWKNKKRISMMGNTTVRLPDDISPSCPCLQTLLCPGFSYVDDERHIIPQGFFRYMPLLRVLDLSRTRVESLLDDIGLLTELKYLDLNGTRIQSLPKEFARLTKLTQLNLNRTRNLRHIPLEAIPVLTYQVRVLGIFRSYDFLSLVAAKKPPTNDRWGDREDHGECSSTPSTASSSVGTILKAERRRWNNLEEVRLSVKSLDAFNVLLSSDAVCKCCIDLAIDGVENIPIIDLALAFGKLENVRYLRLEDSSMEEKGAVKLCGASDFGQSLEMLFLHVVIHLHLEVTSPSSFRSLRRLVIFKCHGIRHIDWVSQLPSLRTIELSDCENIGDLLLPTAHHREGHSYSSSLLSLRHLYLWNLPVLTCISSRPMLFPALEVLDVRSCPKLSKLPLVSSSAPPIERMSCRRSLWESLEDGTQSRFLRVYDDVGW